MPLVGEVIVWAVIAVASTIVVWKGSVWLGIASEHLSAYYGLPEIVRGAVVVAVGSSFPELSTVVISTWIHGEFELGVAAIVGSALFNILIIPAAARLAAPQPLRSNRDLVYKEAQFYLIAIAVLLLTFSFAAIYFPLEGPPGVILGELNRWLALMPIALYVLYAFVQYQDTMEHRAPVPPSGIRVARQWGILLAALGVIALGVEGLVRTAIRLGDVFDTPSFLWGITVVAAGTSVPDLFVSVTAARSQRATASIANVLGSNVFDLLVCIPAGVLIAGTAAVNYSVAAPMMGVLTVATIALFVMLRTQMALSRAEAWILLLLYAVFIAWVTAESFDAVDLVRSLPPPTAPAP